MSDRDSFLRASCPKFVCDRLLLQSLSTLPDIGRCQLCCLDDACDVSRALPRHSSTRLPPRSDSPPAAHIHALPCHARLPSGLSNVFRSSGSTTSSTCNSMLSLLWTIPRCCLYAHRRPHTRASSSRFPRFHPVMLHDLNPQSPQVRASSFVFDTLLRLGLPLAMMAAKMQARSITELYGKRPV